MRKEDPGQRGLENEGRMKRKWKEQGWGQGLGGSAVYRL